MPSFDIVSEVDKQEVRNAIDQVNKEVSTRFDFKGSDARVEHKSRNQFLIPPLPLTPKEAARNSGGFLYFHSVICTVSNSPTAA